LQGGLKDLTEILSIIDMPLEFKILLVQELGYRSDGVYVLEKNGERVFDKYTKEPVRLENMAILPGSTVIIDDNPLSIASFLEEYGDVIRPSS
jgi:hypothetical protein